MGFLHVFEELFPAIKVVGLRRQGGPTLYCVSDGMHRTIAAKESGKRTIRAEI